MTKPPSNTADPPVTPAPRQSWRALPAVTAAIALMEMAVMFVLNSAQRIELHLPFWLETTLHTAVMAATSALLFGSSGCRSCTGNWERERVGYGLSSVPVFMGCRMPQMDGATPCIPAGCTASEFPAEAHR